VIRATASAATPRPTVRNAPAPRRILLALALLTVLALAGTAAVGQRAAAAERWHDDIWVNADGVAFQRGSESDEVAYVVRPAGAQRGGQAYYRVLTRDEQNRGWTTFWEAKQAYPDGYCVVWVEVEDAGSWHESDGSTACTASRPTATSTPTPTPTATRADKPAPVPVATPRPTPKPEQPQATAAAATPSAAPVPTPTRIPTPTPTPSATPSPSGSSTPSPSPSQTSSEAALMQGMLERHGAETRAVPAGDDEVISPLGWVAVLGSGALLATGGLLMLWRRLT
jgi:hypothetical protein